MSDLIADETCALFGTPTEASTSNEGLIGLQNASMGEKTGGGCFDSSNSKMSFQQTKPVETPLEQPTSNIFGEPQTSTAGNGIFGASTSGHATSGFGATSVGGTTTKFNPVTGTDERVIDGELHKIYTSCQSITIMKEYETKSFEELRFEYYFANRKVEQQVYKSLMKWIKYDRENRNKHLPDFTEYFRSPIVSKEIFECTVDEEPLDFQ